jgi:hypothetical protein
MRGAGQRPLGISALQNTGANKAMSSRFAGLHPGSNFANYGFMQDARNSALLLVYMQLAASRLSTSSVI